MDYRIKSEIAKCSLCHDAPCSKSCGIGESSKDYTKKIDIARIIRAMYFDNAILAASLLPDGYSERDSRELIYSCPRKVDIPLILKGLQDEKRKIETLEEIGGLKALDNIDISTDICGVKLENPFLLSSSVVASNYEMCERAFEMGWAGAAFKTICMMDIHEASPRFSAVKTATGKFYGFKNIEQLSDHSVEENMEVFKKLKEKFPDKVIIASIMGRDEEEWEYLARRCTDAGADVIECNFSCPNMEARGTGSDVGQDPDTVERYTRATRRGTHLPILAKMTPNITDMRVPAIAAIRGGANGIAAINTIKSITGVNIDTLVALPAVHGSSMLGGYSGVAVKPIALRFISEMATCPEIKGHHISGMGGIETWRDGLEFILLGAGSLQVTTAVMEYGYRIIDDLISGLKIYMAQRGYTSVSQLIGAATDSIKENDEVERDTIVFPIIDQDKCIGCGRCYISCRDGGHQALVYSEENRSVRLNGGKCVGCQLCSLVCPVGAISQSKRVVRTKNI
ncbi:NAD-dependent dihydropyrimidine dehydrogenase subunit PreA [Butyrivibrio fibrisolvens]|uniref:Dihydroorotate dehydrogenase B (NAD(+)), catalytic subunit n=1 Tax=Butyrivibrio fibrisolvens TaxID=831 RepID=A0A317G729_BUTFI|nr:NAD-dependent dihydropyrimidine dehydrogenase subunit PreA [Butyrivibrio fibrisolvens]PWT28380.1 NAD-dependent dihydropyrimidine dehydrogenase subunit PreA [Butyrivibrio fibrisolvens]